LLYNDLLTDNSTFKVDRMLIRRAIIPRDRYERTIHREKVIHIDYINLADASGLEKLTVPSIRNCLLVLWHNSVQHIKLDGTTMSLLSSD